MNGNTELELWSFELEDWWTATALRHVNKALCREVEITIDDDGEFVMSWEENHPELGEWEDFFGGDKRTHNRSAKWLDMLERLPSSEHEVKLTRAEAYELFVRALLPSELHGDAGLEEYEPK